MRGSGLQIERAKPRHADYAVPHADLFCDPNAKVALARFALGGNDDPPHYTKLPSNLDGGLSGLPGTARTDCSLSHGMDIRIRAGEKQAFPYGPGGGDPPAFFSLWINHRKVLSKFGWKPGYDDSFNNKPWLVGLIIRPRSLTFCYKKREDDKAVTCQQQRLELREHAIDTEEYSRKSNPRPAVGTILTEPELSDASACHLVCPWLP